MKPNFALNFSHDGFSLLRRTASGWRSMGDVSLDDPDLTTKLLYLRRTATELSAGQFATKLIIPNSQVLYRRIDALGGTDERRRQVIRKALVGLTPYDVDELVFDWRDAGGGFAEVAVVARETLDEAEDFAASHRFNPICFVAIPAPEDFDGEAFFGMSGMAATILNGQNVERDRAAMTILPFAEPQPESLPAPAGPAGWAEDAAVFRGTAPMPAPQDSGDTLAVIEAAPPPAPAGQSGQATMRADEPEASETEAQPLAEATEVAEADAEDLAEAPEVAEADAPETAPALMEDRATTVAADELTEDEPTADEPTADETAGDQTGGDEAAEDETAEDEAADSDALAADGAAGEAMPAADGPGGDGDAEPAPLLPASGLAFSTRRDTTADPEPAAPLQLKYVAPRIAIGAANPVAPEDGPRLGGVSRDAEIARVPVTAPLVVSTGQASAEPEPVAAPRPTAETPRPTRRQKRRSREGRRFVDIKPRPPAPAEAGAQTEAAPQSVPATAATARSAQEAAALTIFGARDRDAVGGKPRYLGLYLTLALIVLLAILALVAGFLPDPAARSAALWRNLTGSDPVEVAPLAVDAVVTADTGAGPVNPGMAEAPAEPATADGAENLVAALPADAGTAAVSQDMPGRIEAQQDAAPERAPTGLDTEISQEVAMARFAETGIWIAAPQMAMAPLAEPLAEPYVASIDPGLRLNDAVALPVIAAALTDLQPQRRTVPPAQGQGFDLDAAGLVRPTAEGALTPEGIRIFAGRPAVVPMLRPESVTGQANDAAAQDRAAALDALGLIRPVPRPEGLIEANERARNGGLTLAELAAAQPVVRPASPQDLALASVDPAEISALAIERSIRPAARPSNLAAAVANALAAATAEATAEELAEEETAGEQVAAIAVAPNIPTKASVAEQATLANAIRLSNVNLIGVYGSSSSRRALVRLKSGQFVKVKVGDRLDGGQVVQITTDQLVYVKSGRNVTLDMPTG